eukprot:968110-Pleurochrysis_carterae.AAC.1
MRTQAQPSPVQAPARSCPTAFCAMPHRVLCHAPPRSVPCPTAFPVPSPRPCLVAHPDETWAESRSCGCTCSN